MAGPAGADGAAGANGATGAQGPAGPAGPASGDDARTIVDQNGTAIGVVDLVNRLVTWKFGDDVVLLPVMPGGFVQGALFYHTSDNCSGPRYLGNNGGMFAYYGWSLGVTVFYTRLNDPSLPPLSEEVNSYEVVNAGDDPTALGSCTKFAMGFQSVGEVTMATDPALSAFVAPFRLK